MKAWMTFSRSLGVRKDLILAMVQSWKKLALTTALTCVKFKGRIEYHTKVFDLGLDQSRQIA